MALSVVTSRETLTHQPERAIAPNGLVGGEGQTGEGEHFRCIRDEAIIRVLMDMKDLRQAVVVERQFPEFGEFRQLAPKSWQAGAAQGLTAGKRQGHGLDVGGE